MTTYTSSDTSSANTDFWPTPKAIKPVFFTRSTTQPVSEITYWILKQISNTIDIGNIVSTETGNPEMLATGITPGWWSEDLTAEDLEIASMPREAVLAEILAMGGSWADRPDVVETIENARKAWGNRISELYADEDPAS